MRLPASLGLSILSALPLLFLAGCGGDTGDDTSVTELDELGDVKTAAAGETCDYVDNNASGTADEGCTPCDYLTTRASTFYSGNQCVVEGRATGFSLLPVSVGTTTYNSFTTLRSFLRTSYSTTTTAGAKNALGQQIVTAKLNVATFKNGDLAYIDYNSDGRVDTVNQLITAAESAYNSGLTAVRNNYRTQLTTLNAYGSTFPLYFDSRCSAAPEICDGVDNDGDGRTDENCGCVEICDSYDNDLDGSVDEAGTDADADGYSCDDCNDANSAVHPGATETANSVDDDCDGVVDDNTTAYDDDRDGYTEAGGDCNDANAAVYPGATETANGVDDDCDGSVDEGTTASDDDGDGYSEAGGDCNDASASVHPGATETCNGVDDNCSGAADEGVTTAYYRDADGDTYGNAASSTLACSAPAGYVGRAADCNDSNAAIKPGAAETCNGVDDNCNGGVDEGVTTAYYQDADGDGYGNSTVSSLACSAPSGYVLTAADCNDASATINPGATETCNGVDDNCNGGVDEGAASTWYIDNDGDGYGTVSGTTTACTRPSGYAATSNDCDDSSAAVNPVATEVCNGRDDNCNGSVDETGGTTYYRDVDGDGYGVSTSTVVSCTLPVGYSAVSTDCNDANSAVRPGATETCNGVDDNCSGAVDEGVTTTYYRDADGDGYGVSTSTTTGCSLPSGYSTVSTDCNDASSSVRPGATESCNGVDDNCNGTIDEGGTNVYYRDADGDGYGVSTSTTTGCTAPSGYSSLSSDCNDSNASVRPGATETCNGVDDNCSGSVDEGVTTTYYLDADADGYGVSTSTTAACSLPSGYSTVSTDCNDAMFSIHPGATEVCNSADDNCNGTFDEGVTTTYYRDADGDGYGSATSTTTGCSTPSGYVTTGTDCNDSASGSHPGALDVCGNATDEDCSGADLTCTYTFAANVQPIFNTYCTSCHSGSSPSGGMTLASGSSYAAIVNVPSGELPTMDRIEPGSYATSYLYNKIINNQAAVGGSGTSMPQGSAALSTANKAIIRTWITQGAPNN